MGPLLGFTTILLHDSEHPLELVSLIEAAGGEALASPLLVTAPLIDDHLESSGQLAGRSGSAGRVALPASYETLAAWFDGDVDAVVLTSPAAVREFAKQFAPLEVIPEMAPYFPVLICVDQATTTAAHANALSVDLVANKPTTAAVFQAILRASELTQELEQHL